MDQLNKLESQIDKLDEKVDKLVIATVKNTHNLEIHMKRSELLEELVEQHKLSIHKKISPIERFIDRCKFLGITVASIVSVLAVAKEIGLLDWLIRHL